MLNIQNARMRSNLLHELRQLLPNVKAERAAEMIAMLMDGMWVRLAVTKVEPSREAALVMLNSLVDSLLDSGSLPG